MADDQNIEQRIKIALDSAEASTSLKDLRGSIRDLNTLAEQVGTDSPEAFNKIKQAAGEATLKIKEMRETTKALAGTPLTQTANSFHLIRENLMTMNFDGLTKSVTLFAGSLQKLNPSGLTEGFGKLGSSLITLGKTLLTNPIFLIGAAIAIIIMKFNELKEMGGVVGKVFSGIGAAIHAVIKAITSFTDAIGLTDIAAKKATEERLKYLDKERAALDERYEHEKKMAELSGENVHLVELNKFAEQKKFAQETIDIYTHIKEEKGYLSDEEIEKYKEASEAFKKIQKSEEEYVLQINKELLESDKETIQKIKQAKITNIQNETKQKKEQAKFDLETEKEEIAKSLKEQQQKLAFLKAEEIKNASGNAEAIKAINDKYALAGRIVVRESAAQEAEANTKKNNEIAKADKEAADKAQAEKDKADAKEKKRVKDFEDEKKKDRALDEKLGVEAREQKVKDEEKANKAILKSEEDLQKKTDGILKDGLETVAKNLKKEEDLKKQTQDRTFAIASAGANALSALNDLITQSEQNHLKAGEKASIELQKRQFARQKALGIIGAIINVAQGITAALSQAPPYSFIMAALTGVTGALQIAKIASAKFNPESGGSGGDTSAPSVTAPSAATAPTLQSNFSAGQFFGAGTARAQKADSNSNGRVYVVESDITKTQSRVAVTQTRSTLSGRH